MLHRYLADYENDEVYANICLHLLRNWDGEVDDRVTGGSDLFVENKQLKLTLVKDIDENQLPEVYEGNLQLALIQGKDDDVDKLERAFENPYAPAGGVYAGNTKSELKKWDFRVNAWNMVGGKSRIPSDLCLKHTKR
ncbi:hypothetical protein Tco_0511186 [Tanacetum coccineum]